MILVLGGAAALWFGGGYLGATRALRQGLLAMLFVAVMGIHLTFPEGHGLRAATGNSAGLWLLLAGFVAIWMAYRNLLRGLRKSVVEGETAPPVAKGSFSETELDRYARHIVLREIGGPGQKALKQAKVLVIGAGGLGSPALQYLAAAGVGQIGIIDDDDVENANLQRQIIHRDADIGMPKVFSAAEALRAQNPFVEVRCYHRRLSDDIAAELIAEYDLVLDGTDNFDTRYLVNLVCVAAKVPLISGALSQWEGQLSVFDPAKGAPCYRCVFPEAPAAELAPSCAEAGVIGPLPGVIGSMMAVEAIKVLTGAGAALRGQMVIYDALYGESRTIMVKPNPSCAVCGQGSTA